MFTCACVEQKQQLWYVQKYTLYKTAQTYVYQTQHQLVDIHDELEKLFMKI